MTQNKAERNSLSKKKRKKKPKKAIKFILFGMYIIFRAFFFLSVHRLRDSLTHSCNICVRLSVCWVPFIVVCSVSISTLTDTLIRVLNTPGPYAKADQHEHITWNIGESLYSPTVHKPTGFFSSSSSSVDFNVFLPKKAKWETKTRKKIKRIGIY